MRRRAVFVMIALAYILSQFYRTFLSVVHDDLVRDLAIGPSEFGTLGAVWFFAFALFQFVVGIALDKAGPRRTIAGCLVFAIAGAFLFARATSYGEAVVAMVLIGIGCSPVLMGGFYFFAKTETPQRFTALSSLLLGCGMIGGLLAASPLAWAVSVLGWRGAMQIFTLLTVLACLGSFLVIRDPERGTVPAGSSLFGDLWALLKVPALWPILLMSLVVSAPVFTERALWVGPFFGDVYALPLIERGHAVLLMALAMAASAILCGPIAGRFNNARAVVLWCAVASAVVFGLLGGLGRPPLGVAITLMTLIGLFGVTYAVLVAHARLFLPDHVIGRGLTFINFVSIGGTGLAQFLSGHAMAAMKTAGLDAAHSYAWLHLAFAASLCLATAIYLLSPRFPKQG